LFLKSSPWKVDLITTTLFLLKFSFSPGVCVVHRSQFQATCALWSKAGNLHYSLMRLSPPPPPPSPAKHTQLSYAGLRHNHGGCRAGPGGPSVTDPPSHPPPQARSVEIRESGSAGPGLVGLLWRTQAPSQRSEFIYMIEQDVRIKIVAWSIAKIIIKHKWKVTWLVVVLICSYVTATEPQV
jgi:hypothetical protein